LNCSQAKTLFSPYLDSVVTGAQMQALSAHLRDCGPCTQHYLSLRQSQQLLASAGRRKAPPDLGLRLRAVISREVARSKRPLLEGALLRLENAVNIFMLPATAGLAAAVLVFGVLLGFMAQPLQADNSDVPLLLHTAPQLQQSAFSATLDSIHDDSLVIEAYVDSDGRLQDYRILSDSQSAEQVQPQVKNMMLGMMLFTRFRPAMSMGKPIAGRAVLSFSRISVKG
jgi:hypothetical protein